MSITGTDVAARTRSMLEEDAKIYLQTLVDVFSSTVGRDKAVIELALARQAREVELRLAGDPPEPERIYWCQDYQMPETAPEDMELTQRYSRAIENSDRKVPVSFSQQVFFVMRGVDRESLVAETARLSTMAGVYRQLYESSPELMVWLYTALEAGLHTSYPGHGGYPAEYDPRTREWYRMARQSGELVWSIFPDVSTRKVSVTASMPVRYPDGRFAGVTAIDIHAASILEATHLPDQWRDSTIVMQVQPEITADGELGELMVVAQQSYLGRSGDWQTAIEFEALVSADNEQLEAMRRDIGAGIAAVRRMDYRGEDCIWAYSAWRKGAPISVMIVGYETVIAQAAETEQLILARITQGLAAAGAIIAVILIAAAAVAVVNSRCLTRPIRKLASAAGDLARGNYDAKVDIRTGDELQDLAAAFNDMGPKLAEREKMKRSLELARQVQQHLLPGQAPKLPGFDIAGLNIPCDETGGDYYDFIELADLGPGKVAVALGDVTGHGIGAALLMASARSALRSQVPNHGEALDALFERVNASLVRDTSEGRFMTLFYGLLDAEPRTLRWASGGHDPAIWLRKANGTIEELTNPAGIPLGILEDAPFGQAGPIEMASGDIIVVGTDGIWEAADSSGKLFGKVRLREVLSGKAGDGAEEICQAVVEAVKKFRADRPQIDDITLVVIKATE